MGSSSLLELAVRSLQRMSSPANGSTAVALIQPSPFDVLPAPPLRARYLRNPRRLPRLSLERLSGQTEAGRQGEAEGRRSRRKDAAAEGGGAPAAVT